VHRGLLEPKRALLLCNVACAVALARAHTALTGGLVIVLGLLLGLLGGFLWHERTPKTAAKATTTSAADKSRARESPEFVGDNITIRPINGALVESQPAWLRAVVCCLPLDSDEEDRTVHSPCSPRDELAARDPARLRYLDDEERRLRERRLALKAAQKQARLPPHLQSHQ
jgi:hypothetical protein